MTPQQYVEVDPAVHSFSSLVEEIVTNIILGGGQITALHPSRIETWLLLSSGNDEDAAFALAREVVRRLRSKDGDVFGMEVVAALEANRPPKL